MNLFELYSPETLWFAALLGFLFLVGVLVGSRL